MWFHIGIPIAFALLVCLISWLKEEGTSILEIIGCIIFAVVWPITLVTIVGMVVGYFCSESKFLNRPRKLF